MRQFVGLLAFVAICKSINCVQIELKCNEIKNINYFERYFGTKCTIADVVADSSSTFVLRYGNNYDYRELITEVEFTNSKLHDFPHEVFVAFSQMRKVQANNCKIEDISKYNFKYATALVELRLRSNSIKKLPKTVFASVTMLQILDLAKNEISEIEENAFDGLENLEFLTLSENKLTALDENVFKDLKNLSSIRLDSNKLQIIEENLFENNLRLTEIRMDSNEISAINGNAFGRLSNIKFLNLASNRLTQINIVDSKVERLWIPYNQLTHLDINKNLKNLFALYNRLETINFNGNQNLIEVRLRQNLIRDISNFSSLTRLESLDLSYNPLNGINVSSFSRMNELTKLNLEYTNITSESLTFGTFAHNSNLTLLDLSYNKLKRINFNIFTALLQLTHLKIDGNNLTSIPYAQIKTIFPKLTLIGLTDNEWNCTYLSAMTKQLKQMSVNVYVISKSRILDELNVEGIRCSTGRSHVIWNTPITHDESSSDDYQTLTDIQTVDQHFLAKNLSEIWRKFNEIEDMMAKGDFNKKQSEQIFDKQALAYSQQPIGADSGHAELVVQSQVGYIKIILSLMCFIMVVSLLMAITKFIKSQQQFYYPSENLRRSTATIHTTMEHVM